MKLRRKDYRDITIDKIGNVHLKRSNRANRITISIKSSNSIKVTLPKFISFKKAESFVIAKTGWILKHQSINDSKTDVSIQLNSISNAQKELLLARVKYLSKKYGFKYNKIAIKQMKTRWGSCSNKNNICLNVGLISLPKELQDYVILHELLHTMIKAHSNKFWNRLDTIIPDAKVLNRRLNKTYKL